MKKIFCLLLVLILNRVSLSQQINSKEDSLIAVMHLNENTGVICNNEVSSNNGTVTDAAWVTGKFYSGVEFISYGADVDDRIEFDDESDFDFATNTPFSATAWIKIRDYEYGFIVGKGASDSTHCNWQMCLGLVGGDILWFGCNNDDWVFANYSIDSGYVNQWLFLVGTYDNTGTFRVYLNGVKGTDSVSGTALDVDDSPAQISGFKQGASYRYGFPGMIDEVAIYSKTLSEGEVMEKYLEKRGKFIN
jgi:hypothetical protein